MSRFPRSNSRTAGSLHAVLAMAAALLCSGGVSALESHADPKPNEKPNFTGKWDGVFQDDQGDTGKGVYEFRAEKDGKFAGSATWKDREMNVCIMDLQGKRLGRDGMQLEGEYKGTTYRYLGRMVKGRLELYYLSIEDGPGQAGSGRSTLTRQKK